MIAKSDLVILTISTAALAVGVFRWQSNMSAPVISTTPVARTSSPVTQPAPRMLSELSSQRETTSASEQTVVTRVEPPGEDSAPTEDSAPSSEAGISVVARVPNPENESAGSTNEPLYGIYIVESGDYLSKIAGQVGTSTETLQSINDLDSDLIRVDQQLRYPLPAN